MSQILLTFAIPGVVILFTLIKTGMRLIFPFAICVVAGMISMAVFVWSSTPADVEDPEFMINPVSLGAAVVLAAAAFGVLLLGVVVIARWFSGEYSSVEEGQDT